MSIKNYTDDDNYNTRLLIHKSYLGVLYSHRTGNKSVSYCFFNMELLCKSSCTVMVMVWGYLLR